VNVKTIIPGLRVQPVREHELMRTALTYLTGPARCLAWRINVIAMGGTSPSGVRRWVQSAPKGHPDIAGVLPGGRALYVECKSGKGELRPEQVGMLEALTRQGALAVTVRTLDQLRSELRSAGIQAP